MDLSSFSARQLITMYGEILTELQQRGITRTRNSPVGDYAEWLVAKALGGDLLPNSAKSADVVTPTGRRLQVKCRVIGPTTRSSEGFSVFRSFDFDDAVFVVLEPSAYMVVRAVSVPSASVAAIARFRAHVAGSWIGVRTDLMALPGAVDLTDRVRAAAENDSDHSMP